MPPAVAEIDYSPKKVAGDVTTRRTRTHTHMHTWCERWGWPKGATTERRGLSPASTGLTNPGTARYEIRCFLCGIDDGGGGAGVTDRIFRWSRRGHFRWDVIPVIIARVCV